MKYNSGGLIGKSVLSKMMRNENCSKDQFSVVKKSLCMNSYLELLFEDCINKKGVSCLFRERKKIFENDLILKNNELSGNFILALKIPPSLYEEENCQV
jgi:hypothetical protein